ncbi:Nn.00g015310.m01.CDS01 [Neocucurbitaria sp. VM-36]
MRFVITIVSFLSFANAKTCPFLGPAFPAPKLLASSASFQSVLTTLQATLQTAFSSGISSHGPVNPNDTYSIQIFSTSSEEALCDFHHRGVHVVGNRTVDGDSVYRIASVTKLFTVYLLLLRGGDELFNSPVPKYLPELAGKQNWDDITVGALAGYVGGISSELYGTETLSGGSLADVYPGVFPPLDLEEISPCVYGQSGCTREIFLDALVTRRPVFLPNTTPGYTNAAFAILGLALESITRDTYANGLQTLLTDPLHLTGTSDATPLNSSRGVIVGNETAVGWDLILDGAGTGMGGMFSTANDLSVVGRAILSSSLLPANTTRAWLQPTAFTSSLIGAVGRPWEIFRAVVGLPENNRVVDLYTKAGNVAGYGANFVLIPDYEVGFVVLHAGQRGRVPYAISGVITDELLPALEEAARIEADAAFAGTYTASDGLNSTLILSTTSSIPGLRIDQWISNGTDILATIFKSPEYIQMYPTNIKSKDGNQHSWRSSYISLDDIGPFSACPSWGALDRPKYGVYGLDEFVFHLDEDGKAVGVEPKALKIVLARR